jgi:hypothetical protein
MEPQDPINYSPDTDLRKEGPWLATQLKCGVCGNKWMGMAHFSVVGAECPECGYPNADFNWLERMMRFEAHLRYERDNDGS